MQLTGAEIVVECLKEQGVDTVFGYPGGTILNIYDALYKHQDSICHYLTAHEQGAAHAADGYARATGKVGVCLATSGPGATNLVTGIATAYMDSSPIVAITCNVALSLLGKDSFQEVDIAGVTMPITKHNFIVKDISMLADTIREAFYIAREGRPGPVLVDITKDVTAAQFEYTKKEPRSAERKVKAIRESDLAKAIEIIQASKKPLIYGGGGIIISQASEELVEFAEKIDAAVCLSALGLGGFPASNPRFTGMLGMHGTKASNLSVVNCDLLIALGARFSDRVVGNISRFAQNAQVLHIDIDPAEINKNVLSIHSIEGDLREVMRKLNGMLSPQEHKPWMQLVNEFKNKYPLSYSNGKDLKPQYVISRVGEIKKSGDIIVTEVGQHQMWACQYIPYEKPRTLITSGGLGTMGFGLGAAIGAAIGCPDKRVFNIAGDGCFRMNNIELATAMEYNVPIIEVIINNHTLGMVRQWQTLFYGKRYSNTTLNRKTDFVKLAEAHQATAFNVTTKEEFEDAIQKALIINGPVVINCEVEMDDKVFPMIAPGAGIDEMITEEP